MIETPGEFTLEIPPEQNVRQKTGRRRSIQISEHYIPKRERIGSKDRDSGKDRGYAWVIVFVSFLMQFIGDGINFTFGLFYVQISNEFPNVGKSGVSWIPSIMSAMSHGIGPIGSMLVNKYGCRFVSILGSFFAATGFGLSYFAQNPEIMYLTVGVCGGIGLGLLYLAAMVAIPQYFDKKLAFATGISCAGTGIGTLFFEYAIGLILLNFMWREGLVIVSGIFLLSIPFGFLYKPFSFYPFDRETDNFSGSDSDSSDKELSEAITSTSTSTSTETRATSQFLSVSQTPSTSTTASASTLKSEPSSQQIFRKWNETKQVPRKKSKKILDLGLLLDGSFILFSLADLLTSFGFNVPYVFLPDIEQMLTGTKSSSLLGFIAVPNILSRIFLGYISDKKFVNRHFLYTFALALAGIATAVSPFLDTMNLLRIYCVVYGACVGVYVSLKSVILVDILGADRLTDSFGMLLLIQATGIIMGAPIAGYLYDNFGTYTYGFFFAGGMFLLSSVVLCFIPCVRQKTMGRKAREKAIMDSLEEKALLLEQQVVQKGARKPSKSTNYSTF